MKGGRVAAVVVSTVLVLGAGAVIADRVAASTAERRAAEAIEQNLAVTGSPDVTIEGFPFLTQAFRGTLDHVTGHVDGLTLEGGVTATDVDVDARGVTTSEPYTVADGTLTATLPTATIQQVVADRSGLDVQVAVEGDALRASGTVLGVTLSAQLTPRVEGGKLLVDVGDLKLGGLTISVDDLPNSIQDRLTDLEIPVEGLPDGMTLTAADVVPDGARVTVTGTDVVLTETLGSTPTSAP